MTEIDKTGSSAFIATPPWWMPVLSGSGTPATSHGHAFLLVSMDLDEASVLGGLLAARHLCQRSDGVDPCGECSSCRSFLQQAHGDFLRVSRQEGKTAIGIEQIRDATRFVQQTPLYGRSKVLLIEAAERMTLAAATSLLKTLEEPAGNTLILLASSEVWRLPATVRSRCQRVMMPCPTEEEALSWLSTQLACNASEVADRLNFAHGRPIAAWMAADATDVSLETTLSRSFEDISDQKTLPPVWSSLPAEALLERLLVWIEAQARNELSAKHAGEGAAWLTLHRCIAELSGRIKLGATPSQDILMTEVYRLCRSRGHRAFDEVAERFLSSLGLVGCAG